MGLVALVGVGIIFFLVMIAVVLNFGGLWIRAYTSNAHVSFFELIGMKLRQVSASTIVDAKVMECPSSAVVAPASYSARRPTPLTMVQDSPRP